MKKTKKAQLTQITLFVLIFLLFACHKKNGSPLRNNEPCPFKSQECDKAIFTLYNRTQEIIYFGIGTNMWEDSLLPGQYHREIYGHVKVTYDKNCELEKESWATHYLSSNWGDWAYNIDHCNKKSAFEYEDSSKTRILLYDVTEN
ncbi:hypothetical protein [Aurantibacillus circumpalustris]|uniref:hypothetical protein n=1 Tax=Aurantibacillus circumpalustris TaxID=3036359 RepID=UPI00295BFB58|nr:hypothetical protein [Aurantibacillus circumpalustris]